MSGEIENLSNGFHSSDGLLESIAISLKRIADSLDGDGHRAAIFDQPVNNYGETIGEAIQGQIVRGMRGIEQR